MVSNLLSHRILVFSELNNIFCAPLQKSNEIDYEDRTIGLFDEHAF